MRKKPLTASELKTCDIFRDACTATLIGTCEIARQLRIGRGQINSYLLKSTPVAPLALIQLDELLFDLEFRISEARKAIRSSVQFARLSGFNALRNAPKPLLCRVVKKGRG